LAGAGEEQRDGYVVETNFDAGEGGGERQGGGNGARGAEVGTEERDEGTGRDGFAELEAGGVGEAVIENDGTLAVMTAPLALSAPAWRKVPREKRARKVRVVAAWMLFGVAVPSQTPLPTWDRLTTCPPKPVTATPALPPLSGWWRFPQPSTTRAAKRTGSPTVTRKLAAGARTWGKSPVLEQLPAWRLADFVSVAVMTARIATLRLDGQVSVHGYVTEEELDDEDDIDEDEENEIQEIKKLTALDSLKNLKKQVSAKLDILEEEEVPSEED
jgi:hypothetical protein